MKDLNYISQEISKGHNLDTNLEKYSTGMAAMYNGLAYIKLSMDYYTIYDMLKEKDFSNEQFQELLIEFNTILNDYVLTDINSANRTSSYDEKNTSNSTETGITRIDAVRNKIIGIMEVVTSYVDRLRIYEYVLNRVEYRFSEDEPDYEYFGTYLTNDLMHYILSDKDNVVINAKITEIVGQLPMRLSKSKFFEYISEAFMLYHGAQKKTIDDFTYSLRTSAMLEETPGFKTLFPQVFDIYTTLSNADYANISEGEYQRLKGALTIGAEQMSECADMFVMLAQMVNDVYTIILTQNHTLGVVEEINHAMEILQAVKSGFDNKMADLDDEILEKFVLFEGKQERIMSIVTQSDFAVEFARANFSKQIQNANLENIYLALVTVMKLQSGSDFVDLTVDSDVFFVPDNNYADESCAELVKQLTTLFQQQPQIVRRAVMSSVLSQLPVFFNNTDEIQQYINLSLEQCNDKAEKMAVIEVMKMIIQQAV